MYINESRTSCSMYEVGGWWSGPTVEQYERSGEAGLKVLMQEYRKYILVAVLNKDQAARWLPTLEKLGWCPPVWFKGNHGTMVCQVSYSSRLSNPPAGFETWERPQVGKAAARLRRPDGRFAAKVERVFGK